MTNQTAEMVTLTVISQNSYDASNTEGRAALNFRLGNDRLATVLTFLAPRLIRRAAFATLAGRGHRALDIEIGEVFMRSRVFILPFLVCISNAAMAVEVTPKMVGLNSAVIVAPGADPIVTKAVELLQDEIGARSGGILVTASLIPKEGSYIFVGVAGKKGVPSPPTGIAVPKKADGYAIWGDAKQAGIYLVGHDSRGALFAAGRLIRLMRVSERGAEIDKAIKISTAPAYEFRGHQIGYRNTANSYDLWDLIQYEQYIRDLIIFGTNGIELIQEGDRNERDSPLMTTTQWDMNIKLARLANEYGLDVWIWYPMLEDAADAEKAKVALELRAEFIEEMPRIDYIFVPGGDPGANPPDRLMPWLKQLADILHKKFPKAEVYLSNQKFGHADNDYFFDYLKRENPRWLGGVSFGPGTEHDAKAGRERTPDRFKIRLYPDITHNVRCQFPVPDWDRIYGQTLDREGINPRPYQMAHVFQVESPHSNGFSSYSDGVHDDLNKIVWSALAWDPETLVEDIVLEYARVFMGENAAEDAATGLKMLEQNLEGKMIDNARITDAYELWDNIGERNGQLLEDNWRYQLYLFRAIFDYYVRERLVAETKYEADARAALAASSGSVGDAIAAAHKALAQADLNRIHPDIRIRLEKLGLHLLDIIGFQFSLDEPYRARNPERGALLDKVDRPLNDRPWLETQFNEILAMSDSREQRDRINLILNWEDAGPGGFYDDLGDPERQPHLVHQTTFETDPGFVYGPQVAHYRSMDNATKQVEPLKLSWLDQAETVYGVPILMRYEGLDAGASYKVRVTYFGRYNSPMRLVADGVYEIHPGMTQPKPIWPVEFDIPREATQDGKLELEWQLAEGRGCQVAEVWLVKK